MEHVLVVVIVLVRQILPAHRIGRHRIVRVIVIVEILRSVIVIVYTLVIVITLVIVEMSVMVIAIALPLIVIWRRVISVSLVMIVMLVIARPLNVAVVDVKERLK
jgi:hypothetical protein